MFESLWVVLFPWCWAVSMMLGLQFWWLRLAFEPVEVVLDRERGQRGREMTDL